MSYTGYNQEDSVLVNQGAIDRGMFSATIYHTEKDEDKKINGDEEIRCHPDTSKTKGMKFGNYDKLNQRGVMPANTFIENRDIIMGKVIPIKDNRNDPTKLVKYEDISRVYHTSEECYVDKSYIDTNGEGYCFCKVRVRAFRKPVIGDKVSSRMGQKGTIGNIIPERDMPFTKEGISPDLIINPNAIPSRMTVAQLIECLLGKVAAIKGMEADGTAFNEIDVESIKDSLEKLGYDCYMIFVNTSLDVALERNKKRERSVPEYITRKSWQQVQSNIGKFQNTFGMGNMIIIDNSKDDKELTTVVMNKCSKAVRRLLGNKIKSYTAKRWMATERKLKRR